MNLVNKQKGIALVIVLWMLALLGILAAGYSHMMRTETMLTANLIHATQANTLAEAGITQAIAELLKPVNEQRWKIDGTAYNIALNNNKITIKIRAETGKIDLNTARSELLFGLFQSVNVAKQEQMPLVQAILDWRDRDSLVRKHGAEDDDYRNAGMAYGAKDGPFNSLDELLLVRGMTPALFKKIKPALTVYSHNTKIYPQSAPVEALLAIPFTNEVIVDTYLKQRNTSSNPSTVLAGVDPKYITSTRGDIYSIIGEATVKNTVSRIEAIVSLRRYNNLPYSILAWRSSPYLPESERENEHA